MITKIKTQVKHYNYLIKSYVCNKRGDSSYTSVAVVFLVLMVLFYIFFSYWTLTNKISLIEENVQLGLDSYLISHYDTVYTPVINGGKEADITMSKYEEIFKNTDVSTLAQHIKKNSNYDITVEGDSIYATKSDGTEMFRLLNIDINYELDEHTFIDNEGEERKQPRLVVDYQISVPYFVGLYNIGYTDSNKEPILTIDTTTTSSYNLKYQNNVE